MNWKLIQLHLMDSFPVVVHLQDKVLSLRQVFWFVWIWIWLWIWLWIWIWITWSWIYCSAIRWLHTQVVHVVTNYVEDRSAFVF